MNALFDFFLLVLLIEITPGPNMVVLAGIALRDGRSAGLAAVAGVSLGLSFYMLLAVFGLATTLAQAPGVLAILRWAGVAYLVWLAWAAWSPSGETSTPKTPSAATRATHFRNGLVTNLFNAKAAIFYIALLPRFMEPSIDAPWRQALLLGAIHLGVATCIHLAIVMTASAAAAPLAKATTTVQVRLVFALALLASAAWLALGG